jgi:hypothetical protein
MLLVFFLLILKGTFAQEYRDKIIKLNNDTIVCKITLINQGNVFYNSKKGGQNSMYISREEINRIILDSLSKPIIIDSNFNKNVIDNKIIRPQISSPTIANEATISAAGIYLSGGIGSSSIGVISGLGFHLGLSIAYKSNLFSLTLMTANNFLSTMGVDNLYNYSSGYYGIAYGRAYRTTHSLLSLSIGLASSGVNYWFVYPNGIGPNPKPQIGLGVPIEGRAFLLAADVIGIGFQYSLDIAGTYCPSTFTICLVLGAWNK